MKRLFSVSRLLLPVLCASCSCFLSDAAYARPTFGVGPVIAAIPDAVADSNEDVTPGVAVSDIVLSGTGVSITELQSVTLLGFQHTAGGDLQVRMEKVGTGIGVFLTAPRESIVANLDGTYTLTPNVALLTLEEGLDTLGDADSLSSGNYAPSDFGGGSTLLGARTNFDAFAGIELDGVWRLTVEDYLPENTGSLQGWSFDAAVPVVVPEVPTGAFFSLSLLSLVGATSLTRVAKMYRLSPATTPSTR